MGHWPRRWTVGCSSICYFEREVRRRWDFETERFRRGFHGTRYYAVGNPFGRRRRHRHCHYWKVNRFRDRMGACGLIATPSALSPQNAGRAAAITQGRRHVFTCPTVLGICSGFHPLDTPEPVMKRNPTESAICWRTLTGITHLTSFRNLRRAKPLFPSACARHEGPASLQHLEYVYGTRCGMGMHRMGNAAQRCVPSHSTRVSSS